MLTSLKIANYALIDNLEIDFSEGFSVITGETGAGKSIIIGALSLVLGSRVDTKTILSGDKKCIVEATFDITEYSMHDFFSSMDIDYFDECIVRREILPSGKSRAFINDTPVNLSQIKDLTSILIDIHSQHENLLLNSADFQLNMVDTIAKTQDYLESYATLFTNYKNQVANLRKLKESASKIAEDKEYIEFQLSQLVDAKLIDDDEQDTLEEELNRINHSQSIVENLAETIQLADNEHNGILSQLKTVLSNIRKIEHLLPNGDNFSLRIDSAIIDIKDIIAEFEEILTGNDFSVDRKQIIEDRLSAIYSLQQKHRVGSIKELIDLQHNYEQQINSIENIDEDIISLEKEIKKIEQDLNTLADRLSDRRKSITGSLTDRVEALLGELGMPNAQFVLKFGDTGVFTPKGKDKVEVLFSANKNRSPEPISQIASGGEISRLMLVVKSLIASSNAIRTIIFDEIDTGISGEIAKKMGDIMKEISKNIQVITITHLPQIASKGKTHYKVFKEDKGDNINVNILLLTDDMRVAEIAEMMTGKNPSDIALNSANELLFNDK